MKSFRMFFKDVDGKMKHIVISNVKCKEDAWVEAEHQYPFINFRVIEEIL